MQRYTQVTKPYGTDRRTTPARVDWSLVFEVDKTGDLRQMKGRDQSTGKWVGFW